MAVQLKQWVFCVAFADMLISMLAQQCGSTKLIPNYEDVFKPELQRSHGAFVDLPGFTRSRCANLRPPRHHTRSVEAVRSLYLIFRYRTDHALITPESRVWLPNPAWPSCKTSHLISPATGAHFSMFLARMEVCIAPIRDTMGIEVGAEL
jgi:hypothetical protein